MHGALLQPTFACMRLENDQTTLQVIAISHGRIPQLAKIDRTGEKENALTNCFARP
jgi:hypothetical protein